MSGEKCSYVSVRDSELRRLRDQESRLRSITSDLPERLNSIRRDVERDMQNRLRPIEERQRRYEGMVKDLQSDLGAMERDTQKRLEQQHNEFLGQLRNQRGEYLRLFEEQDRKFTTMVSEEKKQRQKAVHHLQGQINAITADANRKQDIARSFVIDLSSILEETNRLPHQRFAPGQLDNIRRYVEDARRSIESGMPEAGLSTAQSAYWDIVDLRVTVLQKEREFMLIYQAALQEARSLLEEASANHRYQLEMGAGSDNEVLDLEVDYWTRGELTAFEEEVRSIENGLVAGEKTLSIEEVKKSLEELEALKPRTAEIVEHARQNIIASQLRCNIADLATEALAAQGFTIQDATYVGEDSRNAYVVKVKNIAGSEVVTVISPVEGEVGKNEVSIHSYDATYVDDSTLKQRSQQVVDIFLDEGLEAQAPQCRGNAKSDWNDITAVRQQKSTPQEAIRTNS